MLLKQIAEKIPVHAVIFDVSTDRGIRSGNQTLTEIMYRLLLGSLGYAKDLDLAELEIGLEADGRLDEFKDAFREITGKEWDDRKELVAFSLGEASAAMHRINPAIYEDNDSWSDSAKGKADINPGKLAERATELIARRKPGHTLVFVVDEVGQFVARDVQKMLDLQAIVQQLGVKGRGKHWLVVTSQEKLNELTAGLDDKKVELARLMDRFPAAGPPRAVRHLRGHLQARPGEERRRAAAARRAVRAASWAARQPHQAVAPTSPCPS